MIRVAQTHTVWFERPFLLRLGTLLPDYTILGKLDFRSRTSEAGLWSGAGLTRNWAISQFVSKYTVLFLEPIRSLLDPSRVSHTIIGTSDSSLDSLPKPDFRSRTHLELGYLPIRLQIHGPIPWTNPFTIRPFSGVPHYYWDVGLLLDSLPKPDFRSRTHLELGYLPIRLQIHGPIPWTNPFTIGSFFGYPTLLLGRRTTGKGIGANTHHCVSNSDRMAGWPSSQLSE